MSPPLGTVLAAIPAAPSSLSQSDNVTADPASANRRLQAEALACRRGDQNLFRNVDIDITTGDLLFVRGRNGSGKTTLLRALCGLTEPAAGAVYWHGQNIRHLDENLRRDILYLGHRDAVKDELSPLENLAIHLGIRGEHADLDTQLDALEQAGLGGREDIPVRYLSQGQRRRSALARLLISPCWLWILDEPLTALDKRAVAWLFERIADHLNRGGMVITTSHQSIDGLPEPLTLDLD
ncbi:ABC transporter [Halorhodospira halochloris]|uniref:ABC transporter n=1 Tax=Halorhodospira halochloris TaxID=1052 RepID=A0A0X8XA41_HALHR|nr:cytochrome c biogenesis heme-transporting ATPase CcmA [Halorhodospira halochloris]MBK1651986.1 heme ABC exporter ATP-binding protein CcmA [Halorhodospira halochloris]BAU58282.1 ABC transporter [Halorhodospira halochloris]